jgi:hypothetical protein
VHANPLLAIRVHFNQELGVNPDDRGFGAITAGATYLVGALIETGAG